MANQLSEQDFQRLQENLLELKTANYTLAEKERRSKHGLGEATAKIKVLEEALEKANRTVERSKKAAELQHLTKQNEFLQEKLGFQDEQFRLQNQTLMNELTTLVRRNEELESCLKNMPLKESETALKDSEIRILSLEKENQELGDRCEKYLRKISDLQAAKQANVDTADEHQSTRISELEKELDRLEDVEIKLESTKSELNLVSAHNTELKERISQLTEKVESLSSELSSTSEGLKRKHELFLVIQQEKERMLTNFSEKEKELQTQYGQELQTITERKDRLQTQLNLLQENFTDLKETHLKSTHDFEQTIENMKIQLAESPPEKVKELEAAKNSLANDLTSMADKMEKEMDRSSGLLSELSNYQGQMEELHRQNEANNTSLANMEVELGQVQQLAESRKGLIDDMALQLQKKTDELRNLSKESNSRVSNFTAVSQSLLAVCQSLLAGSPSLLAGCPSLLVGSQSLLAGCKSLLAGSESLHAGSQSLLAESQKLKKNHKVEIDELEEKHEKNIQDIFNINQGILKGLETQVELCSVQKVEFEEKNIRLEQELKDALEERKIVEKKVGR
ncbi:GRIP1-associated protein 1-like [Eurytemora carolleeae]|uniref:GRIP1-associated protein 1-like n=1 Tax=Eurytemora carolleeae TaxID=1294199 RepID=UPI000C794F7C|nr:GRIP1-associated protein 1-like [Eurytemora carolleeae]|eukprot:XP_023336668.1 GRIP1-associated protein 1-like [Eurytemora affinis]